MSNVTLVVTDAFHNRSTNVLVDPATRVEVVKSEVCKKWEEWQYRDMIMLMEDDREVCDGRTIGEVAQGNTSLNVKLTTQSSVTNAAQQARVAAGKTEDGDEEQWGVFGSDANQKVEVKVAKLDGGRHTGQFTWKDEGHTLGNSLRHVLIQNPSVLQCGYIIPHPLEPKMVMDVTSKVYPPDAVQQGLHALADNLDATAAEFERALAEFEEDKDVDMEED